MNQSILNSHPNSFVHLHLHTQYSLLDGAVRPKDLVARALELGIPAVAQTDYGNMFGAIDFYTRCKANGIKPIIGSEIYFTPTDRFQHQIVEKKKTFSTQDPEESLRNIYHLVLLCKDMRGFKNLCQLLTCAYFEGFFYRPRVDIELLKKYSAGLVCTTAYLKGEVGYNFFIGNDREAAKAIEKLYQVFRDDFYLEIQENGLEEQKLVNKKLITYAKEKGIGIVATNDCHYMTREDAMAQEVLLCIQTGKTYNDENRIKMPSQEFYFKTPQEMREAFRDCPDACDNTLKIADKCNLEFQWTDENGHQIYHLPDFPIETEETAEEFFERTSLEGLEERFSGPHFRNLRQDKLWDSEIRPKYVKRLRYEINMIKRMKLTGYFLVVSDFIKWSKENGIPVGPGRGSGAGSLVAYCLNITNIDPLPYKLLFERFINPERISMPDFDIDFCQNGRAKVIEYVTKKYGEDNVGQIITFGKLQAKVVIKDVSRVFGLTFTDADVLSKLIPEEIGMTLSKALQREPRLREMIERDPKIKKIFTIAGRLEGLYRHAGIHAAGVIITNRPLVEYCPLFKGQKGEKVIQFDKDCAEQIGLIKFDFLGLKTLTVIHHALGLIRKKHKESFDIESIDYNDENVFHFISEGKTVGVFQLESGGMIDLCKRVRPDSLDDITAINALYRPGPMGSGMHDEFVDIKHGKKQETYIFNELKDILKDTYGIIVYQEQVMHIAQVIAGYTLGQADMLRKAMGKKKIDEMNRHKKIFLSGAKKKNFDLKKAEYLYDLMAKFAEYGFNKSHAVAYSYISYQTAFLKYYYRAEFFVALLSTELSNIDKVATYINDAKANGIQILPPDINESLWDFSITGKSIRFAMGAVKNVGEAACQKILQEREKDGPYNSIQDFCERIDLKTVNKRTLESLIKAGAFDRCEKTLNRKSMVANIELFLSHGAKKQKEKQSGQSNIFDFNGIDDANERYPLDTAKVNEYDDQEKLSQELSLMGVYVSGHPLDRFSQIIYQLAPMPLSNVQNLTGDYKKEMTFAGLIGSMKTIITKKGEKMCFATLEDISSKIECIIFPKIYREYENLLTSKGPFLIKGYVNLSESPKKLFPDKIRLLEDEAAERVTSMKLHVNIEKFGDVHLSHLKNIILNHSGNRPLHLFLEHKEGSIRFPLGKQYLVNPTLMLASKINEVFHEDIVTFVLDTSD